MNSALLNIKTITDDGGFFIAVSLSGHHVEEAC